MTVYMAVHAERMLKPAPTIPTINIKITLDHYKMIINLLKSLQMSILMVIMLRLTVLKLRPLKLTQLGEAVTLKYPLMFILIQPGQ